MGLNLSLLEQYKRFIIYRHLPKIMSIAGSLPAPP